MPAPPPFPPCWSQGCRRRWPPWRLLAGDLASYSAQWLFWDLILDWRSLVSYFDQLFKSHFHFHLGTNVVIKGQLRFWWPLLICKLSLASNLCVMLVSKKFVGWLCPKFVLQSACVQKNWDACVPNLCGMLKFQICVGWLRPKWGNFSHQLAKLMVREPKESWTTNLEEVTFKTLLQS